MGGHVPASHVTERATDVYQLETLEQVIAFARSLVTLKQAAPVSLKFQVAITGERAVRYLGGQPGEPLTEGVHKMLAPVG